MRRIRVWINVTVRRRGERGGTMGSMFSQGVLFDTPLPQHDSTRRGSGVEHRASREPATENRGNSFAQISGHGNLYSNAIDFRPGIGAPVDAPQVAATRAQLGEGKGQ